MVAEDVDPDWPPPAYDPSDDLDTSAPGRRRVRWLVAALAVLVCLGAVAVFAFGGDDRDSSAARPAPSSPSTAAPTTTVATNPTACGPDEAAALTAALGQVPPDRGTGKQWDRRASASNYNACADLSAIVVTVQDATNSSPDLALMFHRGVYVGPATPEAYPFTELEGPASTNDIVVLTYRSQQSCSNCADGILTTVGFQWTGERVKVVDPPPPPPP